MKKSVQNYLLSKKNGLLESLLSGKNNLSWLLFLCLSLTLLPQITTAQTIPNEGSPDWLWAKSAGGATADQATSVTTDASGNVYTTGTFSGTATFGNQTLSSAGATDIFITKHDANGNLTWTKRAGGTGADQPNKVATDAAGNIYVAGTFTGTASFSNNTLVSKGESDIFIAKYSSTGEIIWVKGEGNSGSNSVDNFNISTSGHLYLGGSFKGSITIGNNTITTGNNNFYNYGSTFIAKYDNAGNVLWAQDAGGEGGHAFGVAFDAAGNAYATGIFFDTVVFGDTTFTEQSDPDVGSNFIVKYNANGNVVWANQEANLYPNSTQNWIITDAAGNVFVAGMSFPAPDIAFYLEKYDAAGNFLWNNNVEYSEFAERIVNLQPDAVGNIYIAYNSGPRPSGDFRETTTSYNKYDPNGNLEFSRGIQREGPPSNNYDESIRASNLLVDATGRTYLTFSFRGTVIIGDNDDNNDDDYLLTNEEEENTYTAVYSSIGKLLAVEKIATVNLVEQENNTYLVGYFEDTVTLGNTTLTSNGDLDAFLAKIIYNTTPPPFSAWNQTYGGRSFERLTSVVKTADGGYLLGGHSLSRNGADRTQDTRGRYDFWLVKTDVTGAKLWDKRYGGPDDDYLNHMVPTADGGYLLAGSSKSGVGGDKTSPSRGNQDFWIVKIDAMGNKLWDRSYGGVGFEDLTQALQLATGEYVLAGVSDSDIGGDKSQNRRGSRDFWMIKISVTGDKIWDKRYGGTKAEELTSLVQYNRDFIVGGISLSGTNGDKTSAGKGGKDYWVIRVNAQGQLLWDKSFGGSGDDELKAMVQRSASSYVFIAGHSNSGVSGDKSQPSQGGKDYWVVLIDTQGNKIIDKTFGGSGDDKLGNLIATTNDGWLLGGSSFSNLSGDKSQGSQGSSDYWVVKLRSDYTKQWDYTVGGADAEELRYLLQTEDDGYLLGGFSFSNQSGDKSQPSVGLSDYWLVKVPPLPATQSRIAAQPAIQETPAVTESFKAYPVPARDRVTVQFSLPQTQPAVVQLYNSQGAKVKTLFQGEVQANKTYQVEWQPGSQDSNGLYLLQLQSKQQKQSFKVLLQK